MKAKTRAPPPGYAKISIAQIKAADEMAFELLAEATRKGIRGTTEAGTVLDSKMDAVLVDPNFTMLITPLPLAVTRQRSRSPRRVRDPKAKNKVKGEGKGEVKGEGKAKGKGKGKSKHKSRDAYTRPMPHELLANGVAVTDDGDSVCLGHNCRAGCPDAQAGQACRRGLHVCCWKGCFDLHPYHRHEADSDGS